MHFQKETNLKHYIKSSRNTLICGLDPNVDVTYAHLFTTEYYINYYRNFEKSKK